MRFIQILCAVLFPFILSTGLNASDGRGLEIAAEADNRDIGFGDTISTMTMTLYDQGRRKIIQSPCYEVILTTKWYCQAESTILAKLN